MTRKAAFDLPEEGEPSQPERLRPYIDDETYRRAMRDLKDFVLAWEGEDEKRRGCLFFFIVLPLLALPVLGWLILCRILPKVKESEAEKRAASVQRAVELLEPLRTNGLTFKYYDEPPRGKLPYQFTLRFFLPEGPGVATPESSASSLADLVLEEYLREKHESPNRLRLYLLHRSTVEYLAARSLPIPVFQEVRRQGLLHCRSVDRHEALRGALDDVLALSYTWEGDGDPDSTRDRLQALAAHLSQHADVEFVWMDYPCMPQNTKVYARDAFERFYFKDMLTSGVNIIYLGAKVLSLVNSAYTQRFWPQFEYVLANRAVSERGFVPSFGRSAVRCIQSLEQVTDEQSRTLRAQWGEKATAEVIEILGKPDVKVTNASDKTVLLGKLPELEDELMGRQPTPDIPHVPVHCNPLDP